jgi:hypothetical protein
VDALPVALLARWVRTKVDSGIAWRFWSGGVSSISVVVALRFLRAVEDG